jgi:hypothetical protein
VCSCFFSSFPCRPAGAKGFPRVAVSEQAITQQAAVRPDPAQHTVSPSQGFSVLLCRQSRACQTKTRSRSSCMAVRVCLLQTTNSSTGQVSGHTTGTASPSRPRHVGRPKITLQANRENIFTIHEQTINRLNRGPFCCEEV